jgi:hypothetical protein
MIGNLSDSLYMCVDCCNQASTPERMAYYSFNGVLMAAIKEFPVSLFGVSCVLEQCTLQKGIT